MNIYLDKDFKCHTEASADTVMTVETDAFVGMCKSYIEGYRFVPAGETWTREDGTVFSGEMIAPWKPYAELTAAQAQYDADMVSQEVNLEALAVLGVKL